MQWLHDLSYFIGGAILANAVPHLVNGISGRAFQTPFAKPPAKGVSPATLNIVWAFANLVVGYLLVFQVGFFDWHVAQYAIAFGLGAFISAFMLARTFAPLHDGLRDSRNP